MFWEKDNAIAQIEALAAVQRKQGNFAQARSLYTCLIAMTRKSFGDKSEQLALNFYRLAEIYSDEGNYQAAQTYHHRATEIWLAAHPEQSADPRWGHRAMREMQYKVERQDEERNRNMLNQDIA
jgi:hypothetical protein